MSREFIGGEVYAATFGRLQPWEMLQVYKFVSVEDHADVQFYGSLVASIVQEHVRGELRDVIIGHIKSYLR